MTVTLVDPKQHVHAVPCHSATSGASTPELSQSQPQRRPTAFRFTHAFCQELHEFGSSSA
jgi:hypothetical protein